MKWLSQISLYRYLWVGLLFYFPSLSQSQNLPLNHHYNFEVNRAFVSSPNVIHESFKPVFASEVKKVDSNFIHSPTLRNPLFRNKRFVARKLFHEHFIQLDTGNILLTIDPLVNFELGEEFDNDNDDNIDRYYKNTRGFNLKLSIGNKVSFESSFLENQAVLPHYLAIRAEDSKVVFGQGRWKRFGDNGYDYAMASGYFNYSISDNLSIQAGHGKHFIGNGYRSLLLSDLSFNYPYLRLATNWFKNKIQYQILFASYQNLNRLESSGSSEGLFERKQAASHYIEYSPSNTFSFAFFESVIFPTISAQGNESVGLNFWAPIIGLNSLLEHSSNGGNVLWGTNMKLNLLKNLQLYNQTSIIGENLDHLSVQVGGKLFLGKAFLVQLEGNKIGEDNQNSLFSHYNESLTQPLFEDAMEFFGLLQFKQNRLMSSISFNNISNNDLEVSYMDFKQSVIINPTFNFAFNVGLQYRIESEQNDNQATTPSSPLIRDEESIYFYVGLSTNLQNLYFNY